MTFIFIQFDSYGQVADMVPSHWLKQDIPQTAQSRSPEPMTRGTQYILNLSPFTTWTRFPSTDPASASDTEQIHLHVRHHHLFPTWIIFLQIVTVASLSHTKLLGSTFTNVLKISVIKITCKNINMSCILKCHANMNQNTRDLNSLHCPKFTHRSFQQGLCHKHNSALGNFQCYRRN